MDIQYTFLFNCESKLVTEDSDLKTLHERAQAALCVAQFMEDDMRVIIEKKIRDNPDMQQVVCDLLEPFNEKFNQAREILSSKEDADKKKRKALHVLELNTGKTKRLPPNLFLEYISIIWEKKNAGKDSIHDKWAAIMYLTHKYWLKDGREAKKEDYETAYRELWQQKKDLEETGIFFPKGFLPANWPET
jgi:hypothetical protein